MSNQSVEKVVQIITALLSSQPEKKGKISLEDAITAVNSSEFKAELEKTLVDSKAKGDSKPKGEPKLKIEPKLKDENAPKRPKSAYMFFAEKKRPEIREEQPELKMTEVSKVIGERWKEASPESKAKYSKKADKDKERYHEEMKSYVRPSDEVLMEQKVNQKKRRKSSGEEKVKKSGDKKSGDKKSGDKPQGPRGAKSAYMFFCADKRNEVKEAFPDYKMVEVSKELGRMWKEDYSTDVDREDYVKQAAEDKERYAREKALWDESNARGPSEEVSDSEREIKSDDYYIGKIPAKCTYEGLVKIMTKALTKFRKEYHEGEDVKYEDVIKIMDLWFEHDANMENNFNHLVKDERYDEFEQEILAALDQ
jgi:hypothetical protein